MSHPCQGMTKAQRECFERIAINEPPRASDKTIKALLDRELIFAIKRQIGKDCLGAITITEYSVPLSIHAQWCAWCADQPLLAITETE